MKAVALALLDLFVDDASLALSILFILVATAFAASTPWLGGAFAGALLVAVLVAALLENVVRSARAARRDG